MNLKNNDDGQGFEWFINRSRDHEATFDENYRLGFEGKHRNIDTKVYAKYLISKITEFSQPTSGSCLLDIGGGGGKLAKDLEEECSAMNIEYFINDSKEILSKGEKFATEPILGQFPRILPQILESKLNGRIQYILANSILQYAKNDGIVITFLESVCDLLIPNGISLVGDVPIQEMKEAQRIATSSSLKSNSINNLNWKEIANFSQICSQRGCSIFVLPQPRWYPMHPHRADLLIMKHALMESW